MLYEIYILRLPTAYCYNDGKEIKRWWARGLSRLMPLIFPNYHKVAVPPQTFTFRVSHNLTFENIRSLIPARQNFMFVDRALCNVSQLQEIVIFQKKLRLGYQKPFKKHWQDTKKESTYKRRVLNHIFINDLFTLRVQVSLQILPCLLYCHCFYNCSTI